MIFEFISLCKNGHTLISRRAPKPSDTVWKQNQAFVTISKVFHPETMASIYLWLANSQNGNKWFGSVSWIIHPYIRAESPTCGICEGRTRAPGSNVNEVECLFPFRVDFIQNVWELYHPGRNRSKMETKILKLDE